MVQSIQFPGRTLNFNVFATDVVGKSPTATCAGVPAESARPRLALQRAKWSGVPSLDSMTVSGRCQVYSERERRSQGDE